jgi:hypothetical protein
VTVSEAQLEIGYDPAPRTPSPSRLAFQIFHSAHPEVLQCLVRLARERLASQRARGRRLRLGMRNLWERMRWDLEDSPVVDGNESGPKLNDHLAPVYAKWMSDHYPEFSGVFELRGENRAEERKGSRA